MNGKTALNKAVRILKLGVIPASLVVFVALAVVYAVLQFWWLLFVLMFLGGGVVTVVGAMLDEIVDHAHKVGYTEGMENERNKR